MMSPILHAPQLLMRTVWLGVITTPCTCGSGKSGQMLMLNVPPPVIAAQTFVAICACASSMSAVAAAAAGVPAAAVAVAVFSATFLASLATVAASAAAAAAVIPSQAGSPPIRTFGLGGPGTSGLPCTVGSVMRAAGPVGITDAP